MPGWSIRATCRSILAWSAESEREKILEYANRRWQSRLAVDLPLGLGRPPYGWQWGNEDKTFYIINPEPARVRFAIFHMFVELDMSLRAIAHKLTEDGVLRPTQKEGETPIPWNPDTVWLLLQQECNIGILVLCRTKKILMPNGKLRRTPHPNRKDIPGGLPSIVSLPLYERAQRKLATNKAEKSHPPRNKERWLLTGHIFCGTCGYKMHPKTFRIKHNKDTYEYAKYLCMHIKNVYAKCPAMPQIRSDQVDPLVWAECCRLFERIEPLQSAIEQEVQASLTAILEDTKGQQRILQLRAEIAQATAEQQKHEPGGYTYDLIARDISEKQEELDRYQEEIHSSGHLSEYTALYRERMLEFLSFLNDMRGRYHEATFQQKRNALDVLGVRVLIHRDLVTGEKRAEVTYSPRFTLMDPTRTGVGSR